MKNSTLGESPLSATPCSADLEAEMREAWKIIGVLYMDALDHNGEAWPRAREWQERNQRFSPQNGQAEGAEQMNGDEYPETTMETTNECENSSRLREASPPVSRPPLHYYRVEAVNKVSGEVVTWVEGSVEKKSRDVFNILAAAKVLMNDLFIKEAEFRSNNAGCLLRVVWLDAPQRLAPKNERTIVHQKEANEIKGELPAAREWLRKQV